MSDAQSSAEAMALSGLIATRLFGVSPDDQDLALEDSDWWLIMRALEAMPTPAPSDQAGWQGQEAGAANTYTIDLDAEFWRSIKGSAEKSPWIPREHYFMNDWVSDVCRFLREPQDPEWQRIESAPKDGTPILAFGPLPGCNADDHGWQGVRETKWKCYPKGSPGYAAYERGEGPLGIGWDWYESVHNWSHAWKPTHWMPLPATPTLTAGEGGGDA